MRLLLDTHVLIWLVEGDPTLSAATRSAIEEARAQFGLVVSCLSVFEVCRLSMTPRLRLSKPVEDWFDAILASPQVQIVGLSREIAQDAAMLAGDVHGDPVDRMLIATARAERCRLATRDRHILEYGRLGNIYVMPV